ncbi:hypothetical protein B0H14DRAFT_2605242 [Mycena olivaceomarginata]|nr:hypothetical protein B0H14DRAFT_2605242 [Mycena olivaceomarginata]
MPPTEVIIAGCGIAGPVLALLLKQKGYQPAIYERGSGLLTLDSASCLQFGVQRPKSIALLADMALANRIEIHFERQVVAVEQTDEYARVKLNTGETDTASFVVGCDRLHSSVRIPLFGKEDATFTGLTQTGGIKFVCGLVAHDELGQIQDGVGHP